MWIINIMSSESITKPSNTKFYLIATFIFLVIVSIAASVIYMNRNEPSPTALQGKTIKAKGQNPSSGGGSGGATASGDDGKDEVTYPFRIFFVRYVDGYGDKIFSTKADGSDIQSHFKGAKSGLSLSKLIKWRDGKRLLFYDYKSLKSLNLIEDEVEDLGIKGSEFSLSSDDTKIVYITADNPSELLIYDIKSKKVELQKNFGTGTSCSAPQFISNNSEIILKIAEPNVPASKIVKLDTKTGHFQDFGSISDDVKQFELSPDGKILAFITSGIPASLKVFDFVSESVKECNVNWNAMSILRWSEDNSSIYLSVSNVKHGDILYEFRVSDIKMIPLKDADGNNIEAK
jgi:hypothetical protein